MQFDWIELSFKTIFLAMNGYFIHHMTKEMKRCHDRHSVNDRILSSFTMEPYDSLSIADGRQPFPKMKYSVKDH